MKRLFFLVALVATLTALSACDGGSPVAPPDSLDQGATSVTLGRVEVDVCHYPDEEDEGPHTIRIAQAALRAHISHGDHVVDSEMCDGIDNDCDGEIDEDDVCGCAIENDFDSFEYDDSPTNHCWLFDPFGSDGNVFTTTSETFTGSRSLFMDSSDDSEQRLKYYFPTARTNVLVEVYLHDDLSSSGFNLLGVGLDPSAGHFGRSAHVGVRTPSSTTEYSSETGSLSSWQASGVARTAGWHLLGIEVTGGGVRYFVDGALVRTSSQVTEINFVQLLSGNHGYGPAIGTVNFDDVRITPF